MCACACVCKTVTEGRSKGAEEKPEKGLRGAQRE